MKISLVPFSAEEAVVETASCELTASDHLAVTFTLTGDMNRISFPDYMDLDAEDTDRLWENTCFEYFIGIPEDRTYYEFNQSPSGNYASYRFTDYREGRTDDVLALADRFDMTLEDSRCVARFEIPVLVNPMQLNLCMVVREVSGQLHYLAPHHPQDRPDFHKRSHFLSVDTASI